MAMAECDIAVCGCQRSDESSGKTAEHAWESLKQLQQQVSRFELTQNKIFELQMAMSEQIASFRECSFQHTWDTQPTAKPDHQTEKLQTGPYPQYNAGQRLSSARELLEMVLLELSSEDILHAQQVNRQFQSVIVRSQPLQRRLFFAPEPTTSPLTSVILNPMITKKSVLPFIALYFDLEKASLAYCFREGRQRIYCKMATMSKDEMSGREWVNLELSDSGAALRGDVFGPPLPNFLGAGSWRRMYLSQPPCQVKWQLAIKEDDMEHIYSGVVDGQLMLNDLLEALAASTVVDEGER